MSNECENNLKCKDVLFIIYGKLAIIKVPIGSSETN